MKSIALVGQPNVGKSSVFNILTNSRKALVADFPGLTRDRNYSRIKVNDSEYILIDTGGLDQDNTNPISNKMQDQTELAIDESDIIFFIVDGRKGLTPSDKSIAEVLRKKNKICFLLINKTEGLDHNLVMADFSPLGIKDQVCISASHRIGINLISEFLQPYKSNASDISNDKKNNIKISIVGKPNVGKSTLINSIIGEERFIAYDEPGTTRDSNSIEYNYKNYLLEIIDTAGIRRKGRVVDSIEKFSLIKSIQSINNSDLSILMIDAQAGLSSQDLQIFGYIIEAGKPGVIAINKWDILDSYSKDIFKKELDKKNNFFKHYQIFYISALKKIGIKNLLDSCLKSYSLSKTKISTSLLNRFINDLQISHQPPIYKGIRPKLKYAHQGDSNPLTIIIHGNHLEGIKRDYLRFIESSIINSFRLTGIPIRIQLLEGNNPYDNKKLPPKKVGLVTRRKEINKKRAAIKEKKRKINP